MLNKLSIVLDHNGEQSVLATIAAEVTKEMNQVSIIEHCLAGCDMVHIPDLKTEVTYAKQRYRIIDMALFEFEEYEQTDVIVKNFGELLTSGVKLENDDVLAAAVFTDMLSEVIVDVEDGTRHGEVSVVSTLLEPIND